MAHEVRLIRRDPLSAMILVAFPLVLAAFLKPAFRLALVANGHPHANGAEQAVPGDAVMNGFYVVGMVSFAFFTEHDWNTWDRLRSSSATTAEIILGKGLPRFALSILQFVVIFAIGIVLLGLHIRGDVLELVPLVLAYATCLVTLGVVTTALCRTVQQANAVAFGGLVLFGAIGGALTPFGTLPGWARTMAPVTPTYWVMRGLESVIFETGTPAAILTPVAVLLAMSVVSAAIALARFRASQVKLA